MQVGTYDILAPRVKIIKWADKARYLQCGGNFSEAYMHLGKCRAAVLSNLDTFEPEESIELLGHIDTLRRECRTAMGDC